MNGVAYSPRRGVKGYLFERLKGAPGDAYFLAAEIESMSCKALSAHEAGGRGTMCCPSSREICCTWVVHRYRRLRSLKI